MVTDLPAGVGRRSAAPTPHVSSTVTQVPFPARVVVVDPHDLPRIGMRGILAGEPDFELVTEASDGRQAVALCQRFRPDLVLTELKLAGLDGLAATRQIRRDSPTTRVVVVTQDAEPTSLRLAVEAGAAGFLLKTASREELLAALRRVLLGESILDQELATRALHQIVDAPTWANVSLTGRELEVLRLLAHGRTNQQIGAELLVSQRTAKAYVERIISRLGVANRTEAVARAIALGLIPVPGAS